MRAVDTATYDALVAAPETGLRERNLVTFFVRSLDGESSQTFCFWNDLDTVTIPVIDGATGATVSRDFVGDGSILSMDKIPLTSDLTVRTVRVTLSQIHATVQDMARGWDIRGARVEIHRSLFNPQTGAVIGAAACHFVGKVNKAPISTPSVGQEGGITIDVVSQTRDLTRTNPAKKSDETQKRRSGDRGRRYIGTANVKIWWGEKRQRTSE
jgi:hypothetical protein